ncbi:MAG: putative Ig domain-containing protein, partial [Bacteroidetes bacterium]|nr:putative Ig domain-containing protein [Bacteroidota bacterium]
MRKLLLLALTLSALVPARGQTIALTKGWRFKIGDSTAWSSPQYKDDAWKVANVAVPWEEQGYPHTDGYGWYRLHVIIPSSLKERAFLKDSIHFNLGYLDDGGEVYLNGKLIYKNYRDGEDITKGIYGPGSFSISANDPAILWNKENVIAVRLFDTGGAGGMYGEDFKLHMVAVTDNVLINTDGDFTFGANTIKKSVKLVSKSDYNYQGKFNCKVIDPETGKTIYIKTVAAAFTKDKPFAYTVTAGPLLQRAYHIYYSFTESKSGENITRTEETPYILTPAVQAKPRINGPDVFGERPGNPFLYRVPATGQKPLVYKAKGLPAGLTIDGITGIITGAVKEKGDYHVTFTVSNKLGSATKKFTIKIGDLIGLTPALGWNSWNAFGLSVNTQRVKVAANQMADKLSAHGWLYINIDDGWEAPARNADGTIKTNEKFPDMKALTDYV